MELKKFIGLANTVDPEALPEGSLAQAINVDIDDQGKLHRRRGLQLAAAGSFHSVFTSSEDVTFAVLNGDLCRLDGSMHTTVIQAGVGYDKISYCQIGERIFAKSRTQALRFSAKGPVMAWGVPLVDSFTLAQTSGIMPLAQYRVAVTYTRSLDGLEVGATVQQILASGGIAVTGIPIIGGYTANVYVSTPNGEVMFLVAEGVGSSYGISMGAQELGVPLRTLDIYPPIGTGPLATQKGRIFIWDGCILWATEPYQQERVRRATGFRMFESAGTFIGAVVDGLYIGTETAVWFMGGEFDDASLAIVSSDGAPAQSPQQIDLSYVTDGKEQGVGLVFMTHAGIYVGMPSGKALNLTGNTFLFPKASEIAALFRRQDGINQFVGAATHPGTPTGSARFGDFVDAEIIRFKGD